MASTYLKRVTTSTGSNYTATFSGWVKRATTGVRHVIWAGWESSTERMVCGFESSDRLQMQIYTGGTAHDIETTRLFRDTSAWYHIVFQFNTSSGTEADRFKIFVNGVQETSFAVDDTIGQNIEMKMWGSTSQETIVGCRKNSGYEHFYDGCMSHVHIIDGTVYAPTEFGETDATTGEWKIKTSPSVTYGTNGAFLLKDGNSVTDQSGNSNNYSVGAGTLTNTEDCPSNVFATWNPLGATAISYKNGNNTIYNSTNWQNSYSTLGMTKGKYYAEFKTLNADKAVVGINPINTPQSTIIGISGTNNRWGYGDGARDGRVLTYNGGAGTKSTGGSDSTYSSGSISANDILMVAVDMDNYIIWTGVNGTWHNSATATEIQNGTTTNAMFTGFNSTSDTWFFAGTVENSTLEANFGNGYFGTTAISSEGTNASGIGKFEYDVPTGYTALSTKGLNE
mgnify:CR=1 FL=1